MTGFFLDENMPIRLRFVPSLPVVHTSSLGRRISDTVIWNHAKAQHYVIVNKDSDFSDRIVLSQPPLWVIHFQIGNMGRAKFHAFAQKVWPEIERLLPQHKLINVYLD